MSSSEKTAESPSTGSDSGTSTILLAVVGFVLVVVLVGANLAVATDRTVLDADQTIETMDETGVSTEITSEMRAEMKERIGNSISEQEAALISEGDIEEITAIAITESYVSGEIDRNIRTIYEFLHGERESITVAVVLTEPRETAVAEIEQREREQRPVGEPQIAPRVEDEIPDEEELTDGGEMPEEFDRVTDAVNAIETLTWVLPVLAVGLVGVIYHYSGRSLRRGARYTGIAFLIAGMIGLIIGYVLGGIATGSVESALEPDGNGVIAALTSGVVAIVENFFSTITTYAWITSAFGAGGVVLASLDQRGYFDGASKNTSQDRHQQEESDESVSHTEQTKTGEIDVAETDRDHGDKTSKGETD